MQTYKRPRSSLDPSEEPSGAMCGRHNSTLNRYCCTDERIICGVCALTEHAGHTVGSVKDERRSNQAELKNIQGKMWQIIQEQEKKCKDMGKVLEVLENEANVTKDYCECVLVSVIDSLQRHYLKVREMIDAQEEAAVAEVRTSLQTLQGRMEEMKTRNSELDHLEQSDDVSFLQKWPSLKRLCKKDHFDSFENVTEDPLLPFKTTKRVIEELGRQLKELCDIEFASITQTVDRRELQESDVEESDEDSIQQRSETNTSKCSGLLENNMVTDLDVEPKTRADFLKYACSLSLDPNTAHDDLVISTGDKKVKRTNQQNRVPAIRHPEQFLHRRQVLCREHLQAERCYYEVEIEGDKVEIALVYKQINRKSVTSRSAFGANDKSWSLDRSINYSVSHKGKSVQLKTEPTQKRIGVYLKFKEGTLSFYEVSETMKYLYKMDAKFTEPLYPGFWLGDGCCITICDLQ
ncbi:tripartite motif-containing protein 16-like [Notolabrus celidotus]|uniref:tripartite motif-containing protein 16-like n=1 Tax=Notolabrus celidotus TaxID=1203425 RepID=UPI0014908955|nr:tripartite motif-containing protein 16-like [Notolabrus celidotus]